MDVWFVQDADLADDLSFVTPCVRSALGPAIRLALEIRNLWLLIGGRAFGPSQKHSFLMLLSMVVALHVSHKRVV